MLVAQLSWRGWVKGARALMRGEVLLAPTDPAPELAPLAADLRSRLRDLEDEYRRSQGPEAEWGAERLRQLAKALGMPVLHLGGNSMGGHIALSYAALHPGEVKSLWLLAPGGVWSAPPSEMRRRIEGSARNPMIVRNEEEFAQLVAGVTAVPLPIPRRFLDVVAQERIRNADLEERIFRQLAEDSVEQRARGLPTPAEAPIPGCHQ